MANVIYMPSDPRYDALDAGAAGAGQYYGQQQQQTLQNNQQADAISKLATLAQAAYAANQQKNLQNEQAYQNLDDLTTKLGQTKQQYESLQASGKLTPQLASQLTQSATATRNQIINLAGGGAGAAGNADQSANQYQQAAQPYLDTSYATASAPAQTDPSQLIGWATQVAKGSKGALSVGDALNYAQGLSDTGNTASTAQTSAFQAKHDKVMVSQLISQLNDAISTGNYAGAITLSTELSNNYGVKTPDALIEKMMEIKNPKPDYHYVTGADRQVYAVTAGADGKPIAVPVDVNGKPLYGYEGKSGGGGGRGRKSGGSDGTTKQQEEDATKLSNAYATMAAYDNNGQQQADGSYKPWSASDQIRFNEAANYIKAHDPNWRQNIQANDPSPAPAAASSDSDNTDSGNTFDPSTDTPTTAAEMYQVIKLNHPDASDADINQFIKETYPSLQ